MNRWSGSRTRKATGKSLSDAVLFYCLLRPQFVLRLGCLWQKRFYSDRPVGRFPIKKKNKLGTLGGEGVWRVRQNFKRSRNGKSKVNYLYYTHEVTKWNASQSHCRRRKHRAALPETPGCYDEEKRGIFSVPNRIFWGTCGLVNYLLWRYFALWLNLDCCFGVRFGR